MGVPKYESLKHSSLGTRVDSIVNFLDTANTLCMVLVLPFTPSKENVNTFDTLAVLFTVVY